MTSAPLPTILATNAAPPPGRTGSCGGGRGTPLTGQVGVTCASRAGGARCSVPGRENPADSAQCPLLYKQQPKATQSHPRCEALSFRSCALGEVPSVLLLETDLQMDLGLAAPIPAPQLCPRHPVCLLLWMGSRRESMLPPSLPLPSSPPHACHPGHSVRPNSHC